MGPVSLAALVGAAAAVVGLWLGGIRGRAGFLVPLSAGVLLGLAAFGVLPEVAAETGWMAGLAVAAGGYALLLLLNRYVYPICPTCSHDHDHAACATVLHGFAGPLISAGSLHSFLDGWSIAAAQVAVPPGLRLAVPLAVALHKVPEGLALGGILQAAVRRRSAALAWCVVVEGVTVAGGAMGLVMAPRLGSAWTIYPLGLAAGWLFYLGFHAIHEEWKRRGPLPAFMPALTGAAGAAVLQQAVRALLS
jgi:zinc transporter ZupT